MTWAVYRLLATSETQVRSGKISCRIYGGQSDTERGYSLSASTFSVSNLPPMFLAHFLFKATLLRRTNERDLNTFKKQMLFMMSHGRVLLTLSENNAFKVTFRYFVTLVVWPCLQIRPFSQH
jgi:hypothetical protein